MTTTTPHYNLNEPRFDRLRESLLKCYYELEAKKLAEQKAKPVRLQVMRRDQRKTAEPAAAERK